MLSSISQSDVSLFTGIEIAKLEHAAPPSSALVLFGWDGTWKLLIRVPSGGWGGFA